MRKYGNFDLSLEEGVYTIRVGTHLVEILIAKGLKSHIEAANKPGGVEVAALLVAPVTRVFFCAFFSCPGSDSHSPLPRLSFALSLAFWITP